MINKEEVTAELTEMLGVAKVLISNMDKFHTKYEHLHKELGELNESDTTVAGIYAELVEALEELS